MHLRKRNTFNPPLTSKRPLAVRLFKGLAGTREQFGYVFLGNPNKYLVVPSHPLSFKKPFSVLWGFPFNPLLVKLAFWLVI